MNQIPSPRPAGSATASADSEPICGFVLRAHNHEAVADEVMEPETEFEAKSWPMSFGQALSALTAWLGREVEVGLCGANGAAPTFVAQLHGRLVRGDELSSRSAPADAVMFMLGDEERRQVSTFILAESAFRGAGWYDDGEAVLAVRTGVVELLIWLA